MSSDYEARGNVSVTQIGDQRDHDDTFIGDLIQQHSVNGRNMADEIRFDIFEGVTATYRRYNRISEKNGFDTYISKAKKTSEGAGFHLTEIKKVYPDAIAEKGSWRKTSGLDQALAIASNNKYEYSLPTANIITGNYGFATIKNGPLLADQVIKSYVGSNGNLWFTMNDDVNYDVIEFDTGIKANMPAIYGYYTIVSLGNNLGIPGNGGNYKPGRPKRRLYYFSTDEKYKVVFAAKLPLDAYGCVSLQDNGNNEQPYYELKKPAGQVQDPRYQKRVDTMDALGVGFEELSKTVFAPPPIPPYGSDKWKEDYGNLYNDSPELQREYGTEQNYYNQLTHDHYAMKDGIKNISDVHFGLFITPKTLDVSNAYTLKAFFKEILPNITRGKSVIPVGEHSFPGVEFDIKSGSLEISHSIGSYKFGRRIGTPSSYKLTGAKMKVRHKGKVCWGVTDDTRTEGEKIQDEYDDYGSGTDWVNRLNGSGGIGIATRSANTASGQATYEFIEVYKPFVKHHVTVQHDGDHGTKQDVIVSGGLNGIHTTDSDKPYSDVILYPLTTHSVKMTPFFMKERLMRESTMLIISGVHVTEIKWYEKGWVKIVITIVVVIVSCWLTACAGTAALSLAEVSIVALVEQVIVGLIVSIVVNAIVAAIDDPALAAAVVVIAAVVTGSVSTSSNIVQVATLIVEATGTYLQKKFVQEMIEMQEKMTELRNKYNELNEQMDDLMEEAGMKTNVNTDYALMKATMPPPGEHPKDFFDRALNKDLVIIAQDEGVRGKRAPHLPKTKY